MFVCAKCHEKDKPITKCEKPVKKHVPFIVAPCSICGKVTQLFFCIEYINLRQGRKANARGN